MRLLVSLATAAVALGVSLSAVAQPVAVTPEQPSEPLPATPAASAQPGMPLKQQPRSQQAAPSQQPKSSGQLTVAVDPAAAKPPTRVATQLARPRVARAAVATAAPAEDEDVPTRWYGRDVLIAGAVTSAITIAGVSMMVASEDGSGELMRAGATIGGMGMLGHFVSGPVLHGAHGGGWRPWVSLGLRVSLGFGVPALAIPFCRQRQDGCGPEALITGFAIGSVLPLAVDAAIAWEPDRERSAALAPAAGKGAEPSSTFAIAPWASPVQGGGAAGVTGRF